VPLLSGIVGANGGTKSALSPFSRLEGTVVLDMDGRPVRAWGPTIYACRSAAPRRSSSPTARAVFLDRDGTLIVDRPYQARPEAIEILPTVLEGLKLLTDAGYLLIVVTNQSGIARGYFGTRALRRFHDCLGKIFADHGIRIAAFYYCPHHIAGRRLELARPCNCRKPAPGMLFRAAGDWGIDLGRSWLIGDMPTDAEAALAGGCSPILVGPERARGDKRWTVVATFEEAARWITQYDGSGCAILRRAPE